MICPSDMANMETIGDTKGYWTPGSGRIVVDGVENIIAPSKMNRDELFDENHELVQPETLLEVYSEVKRENSGRVVRRGLA